MTYKILAVVAAGCALAAVASAAQAREPYDDAFFVRQHASAAELYEDRAACRNAAEHMSDTDAAYSNPEYGALSAMGSALDEDALHEGGLHKRLQQAVFMHCMEKKGWISAAPSDAEAKILMRASLRHPEALNQWLLAHEPPPPPIPAPPAVKTTVSDPAAVKN